MHSSALTPGEPGPVVFHGTLDQSTREPRASRRLRSPAKGEIHFAHRIALEQLEFRFKTDELHRVPAFALRENATLQLHAVRGPRARRPTCQVFQQKTRRRFFGGFLSRGESNPTWGYQGPSPWSAGG